MKSSFTTEIDEYIFEVLYTYEKGMDGDGWLIPDDPDELELDQIYLIANINEDGSKTIVNEELDVQNLLSQDILNIINAEMHEDLEKKDYFR